jgi:hypothetical protein
MTNVVWNLAGRSANDGTPVRSFSPISRKLQLNGVVLQVVLINDEKRETWRIWKLLPVKVEGVIVHSRSCSETLGLGSLPSYDGNTTGQSSTHTQYAESEHGDLGTVVNEVTVVTTTVTTRKRYQVEGA